jgi:hypothetical protein
MHKLMRKGKKQEDHGDRYMIFLTPCGGGHSVSPTVPYVARFCCPWQAIRRRFHQLSAILPGPGPRRLYVSFVTADMIHFMARPINRELHLAMK